MKIYVKTVTVLFMFFTTNSFADVKGELFLDTNYVAGSSIHDISRKNLRLHAVSLEKFVDLLEKDRILVSFDDDLLSELNIASEMNGLVSGDLRSTYEMAVKNSTDVNAVCLLPPVSGG